MLQYHCLQCKQDSPLQVYQDSQLGSMIKVPQATHGLYTNYFGIQQCLQLMGTRSWITELHQRSRRKWYCFLLCHCLQLPGLGITGHESACLPPGICLHAICLLESLVSRNFFHPVLAIYQARFSSFSFPSFCDCLFLGTSLVLVLVPIIIHPLEQ